MGEKVKIHCTNNESYTEFPAGVTLLEIQAKLKIQTKYPIVNAKVNNKTESLTYRVYGNKTVNFVCLNHSSGMRSYVRSLCFLLAKAVSELYPDTQFSIEHPISLGYFCRFMGKVQPEQEMLDAILAKMQEYVDADMPFVSVEEETDKVVKLFRERGFEDKALLLETSGSLYSKYYKLGDSINYFYGSLVPSTAYIKLFGLSLYHGGMLLRIPKRSDPVELEPIVEQPQMLQVYSEQLNFLNILGVNNVGELNMGNKLGKMSDIIKVAEALQEKIIARIADQITGRFKDGARIVLVSGPSSSGKTTFRMRLEVQLRANLLKPVGISLDDYFIDREHTPRDENGGYDFESLYALDLPKFNEDLTKLLKGEKVSMPTFNFATGQREYKGHELHLDGDNVLVIEGIHGLNPELTASIANNRKFKIYVSALTTISLDNHNWISTADNRLLRRMIRDYRYRGYSALDTISRWPSVGKGEDKWIYPYQENADAMFNSAMIYELAALRHYAEPILHQVPKNTPEYAEAHRLLKFLSYFNYIGDSELPPTSLLREFLGGSSFKY